MLTSTNSATGTRTQVVQVRAEYSNKLKNRTCPVVVAAVLSKFPDASTRSQPGVSDERKHVETRWPLRPTMLMGQCHTET